MNRAPSRDPATLERQNGPVELTTDGPSATRAIGRAIGRELRASDVVALEGPLGAGKTTLAKGIGDALGVAGEITSPSYTFVAVHRGTRALLHHVDLFRLGGPDEIDSIGWDMVMEQDAIVVVEWPDRAGDRLPPDHLLVTLTHRSREWRRVVVRAFGGRALEILNGVRTALAATS